MYLSSGVLITSGVASSSGSNVSDHASILDILQKLLNFDLCILQCPLRGIAIHLIMIREDDLSTIGMFHFHMTALAVNLSKPESG